MLRIAQSARVLFGAERDRIMSWDLDGVEFDVVGHDEYGPVLGATGRSRGGYGRGGGAPHGASSRGAQRGHGATGRGAGGGRGFQHPGTFPGLPAGVQAPSWMNGAWGVNPPNEMLHVMPLVPQLNGGVFSSTVSAIEFIARPQKPFRGERLITTVTRAGAAGSLPVSTGIFVGVDLQQVESGDIPIETWLATAFGVRLAMVDALPGIEIRIPVTIAGAAITSTDTVTVTVTVLGRVLA
jgi:hypothetical protein